MILDSLLIENFRTFNKLQIPELGRVNLIVGRNSVGKTSLLEALWLYARRGNPEVIWEILSRRDEYKGSIRQSSEIDDVLAAISYLFYGREGVTKQTDKIKVGSLHQTTKILTVGINYYIRKINDNGERLMKLIESNELLETETPQPRFSVEFNDLLQTYAINPKTRYIPAMQLPLGEIQSTFVLTSGIDKKQLASLWDAIALTDFEDEVSAALQVIDPHIERISMVEEKLSSINRYPIVKMKGMKQRIPLRGLGDGMTRVLGIALSAVNSSNGILMIDEFENGLHHSIQVDLWRLIFRIAQNLNIQIFATSHSWDCIEAFQKANAEHTEQSGLLIRLERKENEIISTLFNQRKLAIATREQIEVR